jgi:hypothetical protein
MGWVRELETHNNTVIKEKTAVHYTDTDATKKKVV